MPGKRLRSSAGAGSGSGSYKGKAAVKKHKASEEINSGSAEEDFSVDEAGTSVNQEAAPSSTEILKAVVSARVVKAKTAHKYDNNEAVFISKPVSVEEARRRWPNRYLVKKKQNIVAGSKSLNAGDDSENALQVQCHYIKARVDGMDFDLNDDAYVQAAEGEENYICRIVEMFKAVDGELYFTAQWFYRSVDTVIKKVYPIDPKRIFLSEIKDDNPLNCLLGKLRIISVPLNLNMEEKKALIPECDYYYDMLYKLEYSTFIELPLEYRKHESRVSCTSTSNVDSNKIIGENGRVIQELQNQEMTLLDLYAGCGGMSTGLCHGASLSGLNVVTKWAVDWNEHACESLKLNHPETEVRNETADDFLALLKEWKKLCTMYCLGNNSPEQDDESSITSDIDDDDDGSENGDDLDDEVFEVERVVGIRYGDPNRKGESGLYLKTRWKGYGEDDDTWQLYEGMENCGKSIKEFVVQGYNSKILPLPGDVDIICGGPPCQGLSGFNRFRNKENPLDDEKNKQLVVFMEIVEFLKPKFVLMENVVDLVKFSNAFCGRYALGRLVQMNYQVRLGLMAAGAYGLPQFRMRCFLWGASPTEKLPQYPLPTHDVALRGVTPTEFEMNVVAYDPNERFELESRLEIGDAISDLPAVGNFNGRDEMDYLSFPQNEFQQLIRLKKGVQFTISESKSFTNKLYDHRPLQLNDDDYQRVCQIPKKKGANFRDLPGVIVRVDNKVEFDPNMERVYLASKKPLVPDYAMSFVKGTSSKPFARLWDDEIVPTVVGRAEPHNQAILHPRQDRVLTIRENARLQGFPDYYKLCGPVKERYIQVGNAVAVPVSRALGFTLAKSYLGLCDEGAVIKLPKKFPLHHIIEG